MATRDIRRYVTQITDENGQVYVIRDLIAHEQLASKFTYDIWEAPPYPPAQITLPSTQDQAEELMFTVWFVPKDTSDTDNIYEEWILIDDTSGGSHVYSWEKIGETTLDLSGYSEKGHTHKVTPQTRVADHNFQVSTPVDAPEFVGEQTSFSADGSVTGNVSIRVDNGPTGTSYTPSGSLSGETEEIGSHVHSIKKSTKYLERIQITPLNGNSIQNQVTKFAENAQNTEHKHLLKIREVTDQDSGLLVTDSPRSHIIPGFVDATIGLDVVNGNGNSQDNSNVTDGTLENIPSGDSTENAVMHEAVFTQIDQTDNYELSFNRKRLSKNVAPVMSVQIDPNSTNAKTTTTSGQDQFSVYESGQLNQADITDWDLTSVAVNVPQAGDPVVVATGDLTTDQTTTGISGNNAQVVEDVLAGNSNSGTSVQTTANGRHSHDLGRNAVFDGDLKYFSGSLSDCNASVSGNLTPVGHNSYSGNESKLFTSQQVTLPHSVFNPTVFTGPDDETQQNMMDKWYGITYNENDADPDKSFGRIGNMSMHALLPVQSKMVRCLLNDDGTVNCYLDPNDSTKKYNGTYNGVTSDGSDADLSGASGQVMVEVPEHWYYVTKDDNGQVTAMLSPVAQQGWVHMPKYYVSAYLASVSDGKMVSASGVNPLKGNFEGTNNFRTKARARGVSGEAKWNVYPYDIHLDLIWLYVIEYANLNGKESYNASLTQEGYHQGGLGVGKQMNKVNSIPTGITNTLGNNSGYNVYGNTNEKSVSYRGIEDFWGNGRVMTEGTWLRSLGTSDSVTGFEVYYTDNPSQYANTKPNSARKIAEITNDNGYLKSIVIGEDGMGHISHNGLGGGSTSYYCSQVRKFVYDGFASQRNFTFGQDSLFDTGLLLNYTVNSSVFFFARLCFYDKTNV